VEPATKVTEILEQLRRDAPGAREQLFELVYAELKRLASARMRSEPGGVTLQPTALVHEAYLRLLDTPSWNDRAHFLNAAARAMRSILVDFARARLALKRGGGLERVPLSEHDEPEVDPIEEVVAVHDALAKLESEDPRGARLVELRFFGGLGVSETARILGIGERTARRDWERARLWLYREIRE